MNITLESLRDMPSRDIECLSADNLLRAQSVLKAAVKPHLDKLQEVNTAANGQPLTRNQEANVKEAERQIDKLKPLSQALDQANSMATVDYSTVIEGRGGPAYQDSGSFRAGQPLGQRSMAAYVQARGLVGDDPEPLSLRKYLRGLAFGDWQDAGPERRAMAEGTIAAGGAMVPTPLSARIIDRARNSAAVLKAGATVIPMESQTLNIARVAGDPTAAWHSENVAIAPSDALLEAVTLKAKTLAGIVQISRELLEDASGIDAEVERIFAEVFALKLDNAALYGSGVDPEPRGVKLTTGVSVISMGANGLALTSYDTLIDAVGTLADNNFTATGFIYPPRSARVMAKLKDSTAQPLNVPEYVRDIPRYVTNQLPVNLTQGTSSLASDIFTADWRELLVGIRTGFEIQVLRERYADTGSIGLLCWFRGDIVAARPKAFVVTSGVL